MDTVYYWDHANQSYESGFSPRVAEDIGRSEGECQRTVCRVRERIDEFSDVRRNNVVLNPHEKPITSVTVVWRTSSQKLDATLALGHH